MELAQPLSWATNLSACIRKKTKRLIWNALNAEREAENADNDQSAWQYGDLIMSFEILRYILPRIDIDCLH